MTVLILLIYISFTTKSIKKITLDITLIQEKNQIALCKSIYSE